MNEAQITEGSAAPGSEAPTPIVTPTEPSASQIVVPAQACSTCNAARVPTLPVPNPWVYVIGDVDARYPNLAVEKEARGAMARAKTSGLSNDAALQKVLDAPENGYLVREMCYVLLVQEVETYILVPRHSQDYPMLVEAARTELSTVIGTLGPIANPDVCNGLTVPYLIFDVIFNFTKAALIADLPTPKGADAAKFRSAATDIFNQIVPLIGNGTGMERALAFELVKDPMLYQVIASAFDQDAQLASVELKAAPVNSTQNHVDVILRTQNRGNGAQSSVYARVALGAKLPYVVTTWQPHLAP
jgi:hypothetical protein